VILFHYSGSNRRIKALFEAGINVDVRNEYGQSALLLAASHGHSSSVSYLLSIGADHKICDNAGVYISFSVPFSSSFSSSSSSSSISSTSTRTPSSSSSCCGLAHTQTITHTGNDSRHQEISIQDYINKYWEVRDSKNSINDDNEIREIEGKEEKIEQNIIFYSLRSPHSNYNGNQDFEKKNSVITFDKMKKDVIEDVDIIKNGREIDDKDGNYNMNNDNNVPDFDDDDKKNLNISNDKKDDNGNHDYSYDEDEIVGYSCNNISNIKSIKTNNDDNDNYNNNNDDNDDPSGDVQVLTFEELNLSDEKKLKSASPVVDSVKTVNYQMEKISDSHVRVVGVGKGKGVGDKEGVGKRMKEGRPIEEVTEAVTGIGIEIKIKTGKMTGIEGETIIETTKDKEIEIRTIAGLEREGKTSTMKIPSVTYLIPPYATHPGASSLYIDDVFSELFLLQLESLFSRLPVAVPERGAIECASRSYYCDSIGWVTEAIAKALICLKHTEIANRCDDFHVCFNVEKSDRMEMVREKENVEMFKDTGYMKCGGVRGDREEQGQGVKEGEGGREGEREGERKGAGGVEDGDGGWDNEEMHAGTGKTRNGAQPTSHSMVTQALPNMRFLNYSIIGSSSPPHVDLSRRTKDNRRSTHTFLLYLADCHEGGETRLLRSVNPRHAKGSVNGGSVEAEVGSNDDSCEEKGRVGKKSDGDNNNSNNNNSNQNKYSSSNIDADIRNSNNNSNNSEKNNSSNINADITNHDNHSNSSSNSNSNSSTTPHKTSREGEGSSDTGENVLSCIAPRRGRLLIFPHNCPHEGAQTISLPKILLRGEMIG
jgi:Ankyrin repeats (many copies)